jgi:hypothetical protein
MYFLVLLLLLLLLAILAAFLNNFSKLLPKERAFFSYL